MSLIMCGGGENFTAGLAPRTDCIEKYRSPGSPYKFPETGFSLAPWVAIDFVDQSYQGGGAAITVSNRSSEVTNPKNCAVIKSFTLGHTDGTDCRVVIHDTQGGVFEEFMKHLVKDWYCLKDANPAALLMKVQFGWVKSNCQNEIPVSRSPCYFIMVSNVEANFAEGKIMFELTGQDSCNYMFNGSVSGEKGGTGASSMYLLDALQETLCKGDPPNIGSVSFRIPTGRNNYETSGRDDVFKIDNPQAEYPDEKKRGPAGKWLPQGRNKLDVACAWITESLSKNGKAWVPRYDSTSEKGELIFWEASKSDCENQSDDYWDRYNLGSYIVNGSKSSPVLEFNPKIKWDFGLITGNGGNSGDDRLNSMGTEGAKNPGLECPSLSADKVKGSGNSTTTNKTESQQDRGDNDKKVAETDAKHKKTLEISHGPFDADLIVVGDPTFCPAFQAVGVMSISIILINPYHIVPANASCGEWLSQPVCNPILSNKAWIIKGVGHTIEAGKYSTRISVTLPVPGLNHKKSNDGGRLGAWIDGWKPPTC
jgi:hypothetical protein